MAIETTFTQARANLAGFLDDVTDNREVVIVKRRGREAVAMISADELSSLVETAYLLRSPRNAQRLLASLQRARANKGTVSSLTELRHKFGLEEE